MCYSAMVRRGLKKVLRFQARLDYPMFETLFRRRATEGGIRIPKAMEADFYEPENAAEQRIKSDIEIFHERKTEELETELFKQRKRLADAERKLKTKETKKAREEQRIASSKVQWHLDQLAALRRTSLEPEDFRIFPFWYAPVVVLENGEAVIKPMRYHCRPHGKPAGFDRRFDGLYNARRDSLEGFWRDLFGRQHGCLAISSFYENVALHEFEKRALRSGEKPKNLVLHFNPQPPTDMMLACLWDRWQSPHEPDLCSFAAVTDDPPPEVAATGHNRCVIPLKDANVLEWLAPQGRNLEGLYRLLDDRERPYYRYELAA